MYTFVYFIWPLIIILVSIALALLGKGKELCAVNEDLVAVCQICGRQLNKKMKCPSHELKGIGTVNESIFIMETSKYLKKVEHGFNKYKNLMREIAEEYCIPNGKFDEIEFEKYFNELHELISPFKTYGEYFDYQDEILEKQQELAAEKIRNSRECIPKCPTCGSMNLIDIKTGDRMVSVALLGLASGKIGKSKKCKNCGYIW